MGSPQSIDNRPIRVTPNYFTQGINAANDDFDAACGEEFEVLQNGIVGCYQAVSIDDLAASTALVPGGRIGIITDTLFIATSIIESAQIKKGTVLRIRGRKVRVDTVHKEGDNTNQIDCVDPSGIKPQ